MADESHFIGYVGSPNVHDAVIVSVQLSGDTALVALQSYEEEVFTVEFKGVKSVEAHRPEGMRLYSLTEMSAPAPLRRFVFTNWNDEDDAALEVLAHHFSIVAKP